MEAKNNEPTARRRGRPRTKTVDNDEPRAAKRRAALPPDTDRLLRIDAVIAWISMSRAWTYDAIKKGEFPAGGENLRAR